ncbi:c-type cytochrome [Phenylobacterium montanum]|uniref:C-type cytochrome n=1 Tax=Phenylobacterium montanum TaxID=2823693 RepID=A0A975G262_9CAUL|nr:c-type cytochrome [Caulobacter sp. S6]QUD89500.1 c-type cytochrome [Caulobacter sp. S6]
MEHRVWIASVAIILLAAASPDPPDTTRGLAWAYPVGPETPLPAAPKGVVAPGSKVRPGEADEAAGPIDWFPQEHPPAPDVVALTTKGGPTPCAECHLYDGHGFAGSADIAGLRAEYIVEQVKSFRSGERTSSQKPDRFDTTEMIKEARQVSDPDLARAAAWFAALPRRRFVRVVETDSVPVTRPSFFGWLDLEPTYGKEPIAGRIIELPEDPARMFLGDPHNGLVDYVPPGAVGRGAALVETGGPGRQPCEICHGTGLKGGEAAPPLAGRSAAYLARMLWDFKTGARGGPTAAQMQAPAHPLSEAQITDIVAYLASLPP